jgi:hypothetical protein
VHCERAARCFGSSSLCGMNLVALRIADAVCSRWLGDRTSAELNGEPRPEFVNGERRGCGYLQRFRFGARTCRRGCRSELLRTSAFGSVGPSGGGFGFRLRGDSSPTEFGGSDVLVTGQLLHLSGKAEDALQERGHRELLIEVGLFDRLVGIANRSMSDVPRCVLETGRDCVPKSSGAGYVARVVRCSRLPP